ncbi:MAG TPA: hypothetical protein VLA55_01735 [Ornithinibacter sp.]|nr:hypothetical protein [Ornithinibacter sp.]
MAVNEYPEFVMGQTLTSDELNQLTAHLRHRDRLVGRMTGFGVNCGLAGSVAGSVLTISPGLAVDQRGEPLVLDAPRSVDLAAVTPVGGWSFIDATKDGFSIILRGTDTGVPHTTCTETSCKGHSTTHTVGVELVVAAGRVSGARFDFPEDPLLTASPILLSKTSQPLSAYSTLRAAVSTRLRNAPGEPLVDPSLIALVDGTSVPSSDLAGVKGYKVAWLNMVLFATLDLLRCRALLATSCQRDTTTPGVVIGHVTRAGSDFTFSCRYRHAWEPPMGLTTTLLGGTCESPCAALKDRLESIIAGYAPPDPPPTPPATGGVILDPPIRFCPKGKILMKGKCTNLVFPKEHLELVYPPEEWILVDPEISVRPGPVKYLVDDLHVLYGTEQLNFLDDGVLQAGGLLGFKGTDVGATLTQTIKDLGVEPNVSVVAMASLKDAAGVEPTLSFSPSDEVLVLTDAAGVAVGLGRVAGVRSVRDAGTAIPAAKAAVAEVGVLSKVVDTQLKGFEGTLLQFDGGLQGLTKEFATLRDGGFDQSGYGVRIGSLEQQVARTVVYGERISTLEGRISPVKGLPSGGGLRPEVGSGLVEFSRSAIEAMRSVDQPDNRALARAIAVAEKAQGELTRVIAAGDTDALGPATLQVVDTMRTMVKSAGVDAALGARLDEQVTRMRGLLG